MVVTKTTNLQVFQQLNVKFHELPESLEYEVGMNVQDIAKSIKREPAEIIKKLFMMGTMVNQNQSL